jgi:hypothetical protein
VQAGADSDVGQFLSRYRVRTQPEMLREGDKISRGATLTSVTRSGGSSFKAKGGLSHLPARVNIADPH